MIDHLLRGVPENQREEKEIKRKQSGETTEFRLKKTLSHGGEDEGGPPVTYCTLNPVIKSAMSSTGTAYSRRCLSETVTGTYCEAFTPDVIMVI